MNAVFCHRCGDPMEMNEPISTPGTGPQIEMYQCPRAGCELRAALCFEAVGGNTDDQQNWVEREIARKGSFFPQDYIGGSNMRGPRY